MHKTNLLTISSLVLAGHFAAQLSNAQGIAARADFPSAVTDRANANFLQVILREAREDPLVYLVVSECRLVSFEAQAPQPIYDVHDDAPSAGTHDR